MKWEGFLVGVVVGGVLTATVPDIPTSIDYLKNRPDLAGHTKACWGVLLLLITLVGYEYWRRER